MMKFPILFECLEAKFALLPSSTRIVEQKHGQLRHSLKAKAGQDFTDSQQQYLTNVEFEFREARRQLERKRKMEKKKQRVRMSDAVGGVKHDDGKLLQRKVGSGLLEMEKVYHPDIIFNLPEDVQKEADVKVQSKRGTTSTDKELMVQKVQHAEERKARRKAQFPSIEALKEKAKTAQVDNDKTWKDVDEETVENQKFLEAIQKASKATDPTMMVRP